MVDGGTGSREANPKDLHMRIFSSKIPADMCCASSSRIAGIDEAGACCFVGKGIPKVKRHIKIKLKLYH